MPISEDMLTPGEEVLVDTHPHIEFLARPALATVIALAIVGVVESSTAHIPHAVDYVLAAVLLVPVVWLAARTVKWLTINLTVTNRRLDYQQGVFRRNTLQLRYPRISEVQAVQSMFGRLIGVGQLQFDVQGEGEPIVIPDVRHVKAMQRLINQQLDALLDGGAGRYEPPGGTGLEGPPPGHEPAGPPAATPAPSLHDQLVALDDLRQRGILTEDEFTAKKAELLDRL